jgi:protein-ribulosamine 3-kinase
MAARDTINRAIADATGETLHDAQWHSVSGGDINQSYRIDDGQRRFFVKLNDADRLNMFEAEAAGLAEIAATHSLRVPRPICVGVAEAQAFVVLEYLELHRHGDAAMLGRQLAALHQATQPQFGWQRDNTLGSTPQPNAWRASWVDFLREQRLGHQLRLAVANGYGALLHDAGEKLLSRLDAFFSGYTPQPSLLHGDLWGGNHAYLADGSPLVFDPATYYGDRECDLAMSELFGGFAPAFHAAYREAWPLDPGYAQRRTLYNLYHILNHANLFGGGYAAQAQAMIARLLAELGG